MSNNHPSEGPAMHQQVEIEPTAREKANACLQAIFLAAPELLEVPLYPVSAEALTGTDQAANVAYACTHRDMDVVLRPFVAWRGRGVGLLFSLQAIEADEQNLLAIMAHELSHAVRDGFASPREETPVPMADVFGLHGAAVSMFTRTPAPVDEVYRTTMKAIHHDAKWIRTVLHFRHRLVWRADCFMGVHEMADIPLGRIHSYFLRNGEYERMHFMTLHQVAEHPVSDHLAEMVREALANA